MDFSVLDSYGVDYRQGIRRCMDDSEVYHQMLIAFLEDDSFDRAKKAFASRDYRGMFNCMHELKGACGNADFTALYEAVVPLVEILRSGEAEESAEEVEKKLQTVSMAYERTREGVSLALGM